MTKWGIVVRAQWFRLRKAKRVPEIRYTTIMLIVNNNVLYTQKFVRRVKKRLRIIFANLLFPLEI